MASRLLFRPLLPFTLTAAFATSSVLLLQPTYRRPLLCDAPLASLSSRYNQEAKSRTRGNVWLNPDSIKQLSSGSLLGLACGLAVSVFSKPLTLVIGLIIFGVQFLEYKGISLVPYSKLQRYFDNIDFRSALRKNVAFKLAFGATFALAGFTQF